MKYNKFYFLHNMKNGGRFIVNSVIYPIREQLQNNGIEIINNNKILHSNWHSRIDDKTYVFTVLRDPASHSISLYSHRKTLDQNGMPTKDKLFSLSKEDFYNDITTNHRFRNFQSKGYMRNEFTINRFETTEINIDEELFKKRKEKVNLFLDFKEINGKELEIQEKIFSDLNIEGITKKTNNPVVFFNPESKRFYNEFSDSEKESIRELNKIDNDLYKNANYYRTIK